MKSKPMLFSAPMVRALLEGRKTQTRRVLANVQGIGSVTEFQPSDTKGYDWIMRDRRMLWNDFSTPDLIARAPYPVGSEIWVRETWNGTQGEGVAYRATEPHMDGEPWRPSIFMPRAASRITLTVTAVRVQRLQDISKEDAKAEGILDDGAAYLDYISSDYHFSWAVSSYQSLWESINGPGSWDANPFVWAYTFEVKR